MPTSLGPGVITGMWWTRRGGGCLLIFDWMMPSKQMSIWGIESAPRRAQWCSAILPWIWALLFTRVFIWPYRFWGLLPWNLLARGVTWIPWHTIFTYISCIKILSLDFDSFWVVNYLLTCVTLQWSSTSARWQRRRIEIQTTVDSQTVWATCFKLETWIRSEPCSEDLLMEPMRSAFVVAGVGWQAHNLCILQTTLDGTWIRSEIWLEKLKSFIWEGFSSTFRVMFPLFSWRCYSV